MDRQRVAEEERGDPVVRRVREDPRRAGRFRIELERGEIAPIGGELVAELRLRVGDRLGPAVLSRLAAEADRVGCLESAQGALARRARSVADLRRWLARKGFSETAIEAALARLSALGALDDETFARAFVESRATGRGFGPARIAAELRRRGVAGVVVDRVLEESPDALAAAERRLEALAGRRLEALRAVPPGVADRRVIAWLMRRGMSSGRARHLVGRLRASSGEGA